LGVGFWAENNRLARERRLQLHANVRLWALLYGKQRRASVALSLVILEQQIIGKKLLKFVKRRPEL
jgi:hypothetical protein